jgi:hypothetical protein
MKPRNLNNSQCSSSSNNHSFKKNDHNESLSIVNALNRSAYASTSNLNVSESSAHVASPIDSELSQDTEQSIEG